MFKAAWVAGTHLAHSLFSHEMQRIFTPTRTCANEPSAPSLDFSATLPYFLINNNQRAGVIVMTMEKVEQGDFGERVMSFLGSLTFPVCVVVLAA